MVFMEHRPTLTLNVESIDEDRERKIESDVASRYDVSISGAATTEHSLLFFYLENKAGFVRSIIKNWSAKHKKLRPDILYMNVYKWW